MTTSDPQSHPSQSAPVFLGHRGTRIYARENTFAAFEIAIEHGCDGVEFDVRGTADGVAVVCHDGHFCHLKVIESTLADLRLRQDLPTLGETLKEYGSRTYINIDLKDAGLEAETIRLLKEFPTERGLVVSTFLPEVIETLATLRGDLKIPLGYICRNLKLLDRWKTLPISHAMINHKIYSKTLHRELSAAGIQVFVWTINDASEFERFRQLGVDGIISDDTRLAPLARAMGA